MVLAYLAITLVETSFVPFSAEAQISPDGTVPTQVQYNGEVFQITGGVIAGTNLFHSFDQFSVPTNMTAYFNNTPEIQNIISRVMGASVSQIDGLIRTNSRANLFLLNPNGILFGPNARLEMDGSFVATSASGVTFADGSLWSTQSADPHPLLTVSVPVGLQFAGKPGNIYVQNSVMSTAQSTAQSSTLALLGGDVTVDGAELRGAGGRIELGGLVEAGTVGLDLSSPYLRLRFPEGVARGNVLLTNRATVGASLKSEEGIAITAHNIDIVGRSSLRAAIDPMFVPPGTPVGDINLKATGSVTIDGLIFSIVIPNFSDNPNLVGELGNPAGNINIHAAEDITLLDTSFVNTVVLMGAVGRGGNIDLRARSLSVMRSNISTRVDGTGESGQINIQVQDTINLNQGALSTQTRTDATAGNIKIDTRKLIMQGGAVISSETFGSGQGGTLSVNASESVELLGIRPANPFGGSIPTRLVASTHNTGDGGNLMINTPKLIVRDGAQANVSTLSTKSEGGTGGTLTVNASQVELTGVSPDGRFKSGLLAESRGGGDAGTLRISATQLSVRDGAEAVVSSLGTATAGQLQVQVQTVTLNNQGKLTAETEAGRGGNIDLQNLDTLILNNSQISASTQDGSGGTLSINAARRIELNDGSGLLAQATRNGTAGQLALITGELIVQDGSEISTSTAGQGNAGNLEVQANSLFLENGGKITSRSTGAGLAGDIFLNLKHQLRANNGEISATSALSAGGDITLTAADIQLSNRSQFSSTVEAQAKGDGGDITIHSRSLSLTEGSQISASTLGDGNAGNIQLSADDSVSIANGASGVFTSTSGRGRGGNIMLDTRHFQIADRGVLNAATSNVGTGGTITVSAETFEATSGAQLLATTTGDGRAGSIRVKTADTTTLENAQLLTNTTGNSTADGGNIYIDTNSLNLREGALISAESQGTGQAGNITIQARQALNSSHSQINAQALQAGGGDINIQAGAISLRNGSLISTSVANSDGGGGSIRIHSSKFIALEDSDILANADRGPGGNITINSPVFLADLFSNAQATAVGNNLGDFSQFRGNNRVDISASSRVGISGNVNIPDFSFLQNSLGTLSGEFVTPDQIIAGSCLVRRNAQQGSFTVTGTGGLQPTPYESMNSAYPVINVQPLGEARNSSRERPHSRIPTTHHSTQNWKLGDAIQEAQGMTRTAEGRVIVGTVPQLVAIGDAQKLVCHHP